MSAVVDTSVLIALLYPDDAHNERAAELLHEAAEEGGLVINRAVYGELAADPHFDEASDLDYFLSDTGIRLDTIPREAVFRGGTAFQQYLDRRGEQLQCPACGHQTTFDCPSCGNEITARQHIASDFLIGAHGEYAGELLTFDAGFYRDYFDATVRTVTSN